MPVVITSSLRVVTGALISISSRSYPDPFRTVPRTRRITVLDQRTLLLSGAALDGMDINFRHFLSSSAWRLHHRRNARTAQPAHFGVSGGLQLTRCWSKRIRTLGPTEA